MPGKEIRTKRHKVKRDTKRGFLGYARGSFMNIRLRLGCNIGTLRHLKA